jgi:hypothetical protein
MSILRKVVYPVAVGSLFCACGSAESPKESPSSQTLPTYDQYGCTQVVPDFAIDRFGWHWTEGPYDHGSECSNSAVLEIRNPEPGWRVRYYGSPKPRPTAEDCSAHWVRGRAWGWNGSEWEVVDSSPNPVWGFWSGNNECEIGYNATPFDVSRFSLLRVVGEAGLFWVGYQDVRLSYD